MPEHRSLSEPEILVADTAAALVAAATRAGVDLEQFVLTIREQHGHQLAAAAAALLVTTLDYIEARIAAGDEVFAKRFPIIVEEADLCD